MSDEPDKSEKTEPPSPYKLEQARKKGSVAKSQELNAFAGVAVGLLFLIALGKQFIDNTLRLCADMFRQSGSLSFEQGHLLTVGFDWITEALMILSPLVCVILITGVLMSLLQTGPVFSFFPLKPDFKRLNPVQGFKKFMSIKLVFELVKNLVKLAIFSAVAYFALKDMAAEMLKLYWYNIYAVLPFFIDKAVSIIFRLVLVMAVFGVIDRLFVRWEYLRNMRMTAREVKEEIKRREGDPQIRKKRKEIENELRKKSQSLSRVDDGDVVITNPIRFAVVLKYDRETMMAPVVIAKGAGGVARKIKQKAHNHNIPVIREPRLARKLFKQASVDSAIPPDTFISVARVFSKLYRRQSQQQKVSG